MRFYLGRLKLLSTEPVLPATEAHRCLISGHGPRPNWESPQNDTVQDRQVVVKYWH